MSKIAKKRAKVKPKPTKVKPKPTPKVPKAPHDELAAIRDQYEKATRQLSEVDATLEKEGLVVAVPIYNRSGKKVGQKRQRHPLAAIQRALRSDVVRLARVLHLHKPEPEESKPGNAKDQKNALEKLYDRCWELLAQQGDLLAERDARYRDIRAQMPPGPPWPDIPDDPEWTKRWERSEAEYAELEAQTAAHKGFSNNDDYRQS
jgi:hypothetical protein